MGLGETAPIPGCFAQGVPLRSRLRRSSCEQSQEVEARAAYHDDPDMRLPHLQELAYGRKYLLELCGA